MRKELEAAIAAHPDDPDGYLVYADWLQSQGDPRGELIVLSQRGMESAALAFVQRHAAHFLGPFAEHRPREFGLGWRHGFIRSARIGWESFEGDAEAHANHLDEFLQHESCRFIEALSLGPLPGDDLMYLDPLAEVIDRRALPSLRELYLGDIGRWDISGTTSAMPHSASMPNLRRLKLRGGSFTMRDIDLPELQSFTIETGGLAKGELKFILDAKWPKLEELVIWFGDPNYGCDIAIDDIAPILAGENLAGVRKLGLMNAEIADSIASALCASKILPQLESLDLSMGCLSDDGLATMLAAKDRFAHLALLNLADNGLTDRHQAAAPQLAKQIVFGKQDVDRVQYRYVAVGE